MKKLTVLTLAIIMLITIFPLVICASTAEGENKLEGKTIACIGDSITAAVGVTKDENDYVTLLAEQLGMDYLRLGVSGTTLCTGGHRTCNIGKLTESNLAGSDVVTILMGINDFDQAKAGYYTLGDISSTDTSTVYGAMRMWCERIVELRKTDTLSETEFYFITPMITSWNDSVSYSRDWDQSKTNVHGYTLRDMCNAIIEVSALYGIKSIDLNLISGIYYNSAEDNNISLFGGDGVHPGAVGHSMMAKAIANVLTGKDQKSDHEHTYTSWVITTYPSCAKGEEKRVCTVCSATENREAAAIKEHSYERGICSLCGTEHPNTENYKGKIISILGDSISTFKGYIPISDGFNLNHRPRYPQDNLLSDVNETWWMQIIHDLDAKLGINDSWAGSIVTNTISGNSGDQGENAAMASLTRIQNLGSNGTPDVILFYGGTNDIGHSMPLGSFDSSDAPTVVDLSSTRWDSVADAYVEAILRMKYFYPNAEIIAMLPTYTSSYYTNSRLAEYNAVFAEICEHYEVTYVDLRYCGITTSDLPDGIHPDATGMDYITESVAEILLNECEISAGENIVHSVTHNLTNAEAGKSYYKGISDGYTFDETLLGEDLSITVIMGGVDITDSVLVGNAIHISAVTGDVVITATAKLKPIYEEYLQQFPESVCLNTNLWNTLEHDNIYYTSSGWGNLSGNTVYSVTIPVNSGDRIFATSFGANPSNGNTTNSSSGIRVTWFGEIGVLKSMSPSETYAEFAQNGYLTAPEGAFAINIPMWNNSDDNEVYILNREHSYTPTITPPTCTEQGYTTYTCECGDSNVGDYVEAMGHTYKNGICALCQSVSPLYNKNVSILGDSISTFAGISKCSSSFYNGSNRNVLSVYDTWWGKLIEDHGMSLCVNYSQGGKAMFDSAVYNNRVLELHTDDSSPDIIFVFLGHNDKLEQVKPFEDIRWSMIIQESADGTYTYAEPDSFTEAYAIAVHKMLEEYPLAEVVLLQCLMAETSETYNQINPIIQAIGDKFGLTVVDFYENGLCRENKTYFPNDVHPNKAGMNKITDILEQVLENTHLHSFNSVVTPPTCTEQGYTTYTCECGDSYVSDYVKVVDHSYGLWIESIAPTCNSEGKDVRTCEDCGYLQYRDTRISGDLNKILVSSPVDISFFDGKVLMAIGDSITAGTGVTAEERYHYLTAQALGMTNINSGTSGAVLCPGGHLPNKFDTLMTAEFLKNRNVDVVTILLGVNDWDNGVINGTYQGKLKYDENATYYDLGVFGTDDTTTIYGAAKMWCERILELKATDGCEDIQFIFLTPVITSYNKSITYDKDWDQTKLNVFGYTLRRYCQAIMEVCAYYEIPVLDLNMYSEMYYHSETDNNVDHFGGDGIHPAANGHAMMADALVEFLLEGYSYEIRSNLGHDYNETIKEPTCTEGGSTTFSCPDCYYSYVTDEREAQGHNYIEKLTPPTCTEQGYTTYTCECGDSYISDYVDATGHNMGEWFVVTEATCTDDGEKQRKCNNCGYYEAESVNANGHNYSAVTTNPTCTEQGYTTYTCKCGDTYVSDYVDALGHIYGEWQLDDEYHWRACSTCGAPDSEKEEHVDQDENELCDLCSKEMPKAETPEPNPEPDPKPEPEPEPPTPDDPTVEPEAPTPTPDGQENVKQSFIAMFLELLIELLKDIARAFVGIFK